MYQPVGMDMTSTAQNPSPADSRTRLLDAATQVIRAKGYTATTVDDICHAAGVTKGSFFHHFKGKEESVLAAVQRWNDVTGALFGSAPYRRIADPRERVLAYLDLRTSLLQGDAADYTCLLGTLVQEAHATLPAIRAACEQGIALHAATVAGDLAAAKALYAPAADWRPETLALYTQASIQGAFILAKAQGGPQVAADCIAHLRRYLECLLGTPPRARRAAAARRKPMPRSSHPRPPKGHP